MLDPFRKFPKIVYAVSTQTDGNMSFAWGDKAMVAGNREKFLSTHRLTPQNCVVADLTHGMEIAKINKLADVPVHPHGYRAKVADALITKTPGICLLLVTGDCAPVVLYSPARRVVALIHVSWKNAGRKFVTKVIRTLATHYACQPANLRMHIGPCIHKESYRFKTLELQNRTASWQPFLTATTDQMTMVDLPGFVIAQARAAGVAPPHISIDPTDTCRSINFFSHYRAGRTGEAEGRFATVVSIHSTDSLA